MTLVAKFVRKNSLRYFILSVSDKMKFLKIFSDHIKKIVSNSVSIESSKIVQHNFNKI